MARINSLLGYTLLILSLWMPLTARAFGLDDPFNTKGELPVTQPKPCDLTNTPNALTLTQAIDLALCRNPDTQAAWASAQIAAAGLGQSKSAYLPSIDAGASLTRGYASHVNVSSSGSSGGNTITGPYTSYGPELSLSYLLFDFGGREADVEAARQTMLQAGWNYSSTMQALVFQVIKAYADVFSSQEAVESAKDSQNSSKQAFDAAKARLAVGVVTPADTALAETAYAQSQLATMQAENELSIAQGTLTSLLHLPPTHTLALTPLEIQPSQNPVKEDVEALIKKALQERPDLAASRANQDKAKAELDRARALNYPSLSLAGDTGATHYFDDLSPQRRSGALTLRLSMPIFTGFNNHYQIVSARGELAQAEAQHNKAEDEVSLDVWTSYHNRETAEQNYVTTQTLITSAEKAEALALGRYKYGTGTLLDALDAQAKLADARRQWVAARYNLLVTRFDLARALGNTSSQSPPD